MRTIDFLDGSHFFGKSKEIYEYFLQKPAKTFEKKCENWYNLIME